MGVWSLYPVHMPGTYGGIRNWSYRWLGAAVCVLGTEPQPVEEQLLLLTTRLSLYPICMLF